jgi:hypothetical protein
MRALPSTLPAGAPGPEKQRLRRETEPCRRVTESPSYIFFFALAFLAFLAFFGAW